MNVRNTATEILLQAIRCVSAICEERCSRVIDQLESTSEVSLEVIQSFELAEATVAYHRRGGMLRGAPQTARNQLPHLEAVELEIDRRTRRGAAAPTLAEDQAMSALPGIDSLTSCILSLRSLASLYGVLGRAAGVEGFPVLAEGARRYRRDITELKQEITRYCSHGRQLTPVIRSPSALG